ncbi:hypothetical protein JTE90_029420 [Oedothorax gibbosus]|uniref:MD-2-related lipid-recognition domain-containing protein n=1 Tax=Oedothorax gibbosus TaxID=931172 RepID=A0AAV6U014_9ARAC|nr:hypothetical protein JTE90_029420 [Oedothorax gibbosus]
MAVVHGVIGGMPLPFPVPNPDGCKFGGLTCPLENGKTYTYTHNLFIRSSYPPLGVKVRWELQDEAGKDIVCIEIPCHIQ